MTTSTSRRFLVHPHLLAFLSVLSTGTLLIGCASTREQTTAGRAGAATLTGPLHVHPENPRYFADGSGRVVYLTGSHTWNNLVDVGIPANQFDFTGYLDFLDRHHHNFIRLWRVEVLRWDVAISPQWTTNTATLTTSPHPWKRTGPGTAADGQPKFDLNQLDPDYFARLRSRVAEARTRGIYVAVMLFEGWGLQHLPDAFTVHPFHPDNNINGIDADADGDGYGIEAHTMTVPEVLKIQEAYVARVVDTVNEFDNVLYEIGNEIGTYSREWQHHLIRFIKDRESRMPAQHPVGITYMHSSREQYRGTNIQLFDSPADWMSPSREAPVEYDYRHNPPPADGRKVVISDTDHFFAIGGSPDWVWKAFTRGQNPIFMDPWDNSVLGKDPQERWAPLRMSLGHTRRLADRLNLVDMVPREDLASTRYALASPGRKYVVFLPEGGSVEVDLADARGSLMVEWIHPVEGTSHLGTPAAGGARTEFTAPFKGSAVLVLRADGPA